MKDEELMYVDDNGRWHPARILSTGGPFAYVELLLSGTCTTVRRSQLHKVLKQARPAAVPRHIPVPPPARSPKMRRS